MAKKYLYRKTFTFEGKRYNAYGNTEKEALLRMFEKKKALEEGRITTSGNTTVSDWTMIAIDTYKPNLAERTKADDMTRIRKHILSRIGSLPLKSVRPIDCQEIMNAQAGMSHAHIAKLSQELKFIFETAKKNKLILENPADDLVKPKAIARNRCAISPVERAAFLKVCEGNDRFLVFELMLYCGCRPSEAVRSCGADLSLQNGVPMLHIRGTKTYNSDRVVPMPTVLYERLKGRKANDPLAPNERGSFYTESSYKRRKKTLNREMNIALGCKVYRNELIPPYPLRESFVPYELRHTYCTDLAKRKIDVRVAQRLMGHSSIQITADIYTHIQEEQLVEEASKILGQ